LVEFFVNDVEKSEKEDRMSKPIWISREELYENVWSTPMMQLAKEFNMSDVGLDKVCKKMEIPRPGRGYWRKIETGQKPKLKKLPALTKNGQSRVQIWPEKYRNESLPKIDKQTTNIDFMSALVDPHPLVEATQNTLLNGKPDEKGIIKKCAKRVLQINVTHGTVDRALLIMDTILKEAEKRGYFVALEKQDEGCKTTITVEGYTIEISLSEIIRAVKHESTEADEEKYRSRPWLMPRYDYIATGKLSLRIENAEYLGVRQKWNDAKVQRIDNYLGDFLDGLVLTAKAKEQRRIREEQEQREREHQAMLRKVREREKRIEDKKIAKIEDEAERWHRAEKIRDYIAAMSQRADMMADLQIKAWVEWCGLYADHLDPLIFKNYELVAEDDVSWENRWW